MDEIVVLTTADSLDLARRIALALVEARAAACVNILSPVRSVYRWEGKLCDEEEWLLLIKSTSARFAAVRSTIRRLHSYSLPEIIALNIRAGDEAYLDWLRTQVGPSDRDSLK
jgi:periplasmic divalent cation tolerance protein